MAIGIKRIALCGDDAALMTTIASLLLGSWYFVMF